MKFRCLVGTVLLLSAISLVGCGNKSDLVKPGDIPPPAKAAASLSSAEQ